MVSGMVSGKSIRALVRAVWLLVVLGGLAGCSKDTEQASKTAGGVPAAATTGVGATPSEPARVASAARQGKVSRQDVLAIEGLVPQDAVRALLGQAPTRVGPLSGQKPSPTYNALRYHGVRGEDLGLSVQVWKLADAAQAGQRLESLRTQYLGIQAPPSGAMPASFAADRSGVRTYAFAPSGASLVVVLSCSSTLCPDFGGLVQMGVRVADALAKTATP